METVDKIKAWVKENAPMFSVLYENKYLGMLYDRFASLNPKQQKQIILGVAGLGLSLLLGYLLYSYISLWTISNDSKKAYAMLNLLQQYQKERRNQSSQIQSLDRNSQLAPPGEFKKHLMDQGRASGISPRMIEVKERGEAGGPEGETKGSGDVKMVQASVTLQRINLNQLKTFLNSIEFGQYNLGVSSIKISNDDKLRGYMKVEMGVVAYLFRSEEGG